ncbi:MAG: hypothetical protein JW740_00425 [Candidatus Zambryskibacteria bacterium]|nr:hypothetical protein [Candidatus Zambryskibacteria bacterium]
MKKQKNKKIKASNKMKKFLLISMIGIISPKLVLAQQVNFSISNDGIAYASRFTSDLSLLLSVVIGLIATYLVFRAVKKLKGGLFGSILNFISLGMLFIVLGTIAVFMNSWFPGIWFNIISTAFFAMGYIFMVVGANKLLKGVMNV